MTPIPTTALTEEQIESYHTNGFLAIDAITTQEEVERLRVVYDQLFEQNAGRAEGNQFDLAGTDEDGKPAKLPQILNPRKYAPALEQTLYEANALTIARQLLGAEAMLSGDHAIFKPAGVGAATPWHQDEAYWDPNVQYNALSVWMPLQEATLENGCMVFIPGSQNDEIHPHQSIGGDIRVHGLEMLQSVDPSQTAACPLPAGGATFHGSRTIHSTGANRSATPRRAYILNFETSRVPYPAERRFPWNDLKRTARDERARKPEVSSLV